MCFRECKGAKATGNEILTLSKWSLMRPPTPATSTVQATSTFSLNLFVFGRLQWQSSYGGAIGCRILGLVGPAGLDCSWGCSKIIFPLHKPPPIGTLGYTIIPGGEEWAIVILVVMCCIGKYSSQKPIACKIICQWTSGIIYKSISFLLFQIHYKKYTNRKLS